MLAVRLIEQVGAYAGLAAIPGLAVLSALYFSQARDVKRLREWAGRAPERAAEQAVGGRVPVPAQPQTPAAATPATAAQPAQAGAAAKPAAATPAAAAAGAGAAKPAVAAAAGAQAATAAGPAAAEAEKTATPDAGKAATNGEAPSEAKTDKPAALTPAAVASAAAAKAPAKAAGPPPVGAAKPAAAGSPAARRPIPRVPSAQTSILTSASPPPRDRWYRRLGARLPAARYIALIVAGALVLGGGAAFGISQLANKDSGGGSKSSGSPGNGSTKAPSSDGSSPKKDQNVTARPAVNPADVTVTVVNGTTIPNLARDTASKLGALGFKIGNKVTGTGSLAAAESVVQYRPGAEEEARYVAAKLNISQKQAADPDALALAGVAQVIVVLGADQAPGG